MYKCISNIIGSENEWAKKGSKKQEKGKSNWKILPKPGRGCFLFPCWFFFFCRQLLVCFSLTDFSAWMRTEQQRRGCERIRCDCCYMYRSEHLPLGKIDGFNFSTSLWWQTHAIKTADTSPALLACSESPTVTNQLKTLCYPCFLFYFFAGVTSWTWGITSSRWMALTWPSCGMMRSSACWRTWARGWCWK